MVIQLGFSIQKKKTYKGGRWGDGGKSQNMPFNYYVYEIKF